MLGESGQSHCIYTWCYIINLVLLISSSYLKGHNHDFYCIINWCPGLYCFIVVIYMQRSCTFVRRKTWVSSVSQVWLWSQWRLPVRGGTLLGWGRHQHRNAGLVWLSYIRAGWYNKIILIMIIIVVLYVSHVPDVALDREVEGDLLVGDMGQGMPFRPGTFDGCIRWRTKQTNKDLSRFILSQSFTLSFVVVQYLCPAVAL